MVLVVPLVDIAEVARRTIPPLPSGDFPSSASCSDTQSTRRVTARAAWTNRTRPRLHTSSSARFGEGSSFRFERMGKPRGSTSPLHGAMNIISSLLLCLTFGRLVIVLYRYFETSSEITGNNRVPFWFPPPQPHGGKGPLTQKYHRLHASSQLTAYGAGRRGEAMPAELETQLSNLRESHAFFGDSQRSNVRLWDRTITKEGFGYSSSSSSSVRGVSGSATGSGVASPTYAWGRGMKVLVCAVDAMHENAVGSTSVLAAENMLRESLTDTLIEAGVQVRRRNHISTSDLSQVNIYMKPVNSPNGCEEDNIYNNTSNKNSRRLRVTFKVHTELHL